MEYITINKYETSFSVPVSWLLMQIEGQSIDDFLNSYTYDDGEYLYSLYFQ